MVLFKLDKESFNLLMEGSKNAVLFNIILAFLLSLILIYDKVPLSLVGGWLAAIIIINLIRWFFCKKNIKNNHYEKNHQINILKFFLLTLVTSIVWVSCYFIVLPYLPELDKFIIILVYGGMCAGSIASLSPYLPAYYAYILPIFFPIIIYNYYLFNIDGIILGSMFLLFTVMLITSAKINNKLLRKTFELSSKLQIISITDALTGLYNRRYFTEMLSRELNQAKRNKNPFNLVFIDVDNFKLINDNLGHPKGDTFLVDLGSLLNRACKRANDFSFRIGGDEFALILVNQSLDETISRCQQICVDFLNISNPICNILLKQSISDKVTLSMGIVNIHVESQSNMDQIISAADTALYEAKKKGKNQIIVTEIF